ncbi:hypothetical protein EYC84_010461 [Monilinia fructicola]|uniref:FAD-binding PCMH-type domain-containing protein n=1 Tax=Monilinia fructicola TaxID=38448 RepID=A0A5M9JCV7_MONFR|nr:hypothetical protein EYC84_010461 [Monilinia fructicola]
MLRYLFHFFALLSLAFSADPGDKSISRYSRGCKCGPTDGCWPSQASWKSLNASISGRLIETAPAAIVCYPGPQQNLEACSTVLRELSDEELVANDPIALDFPINNACPPVDFSAGDVPGNCSIGNAPRYVVNATKPEDVAMGVDFARKNNIRLVIRNTGHDLLGRSTGYGSLEVWIRYLRQGSAFRIAGGYVWEDVYAEAMKRNVIVVGGGDPTVGCLGGWAQGGGHSPASRDYGLGADQILEAEVVLANGKIVTANRCQNQDLYFAIRGGGGGTYGVVVSTVVKVYPTTSISAQTLAIAPLSDANIPEFMDALNMVYSAYPDLNDAGLSGYGSWAKLSGYKAVAGIGTGALGSRLLDRNALKSSPTDLGKMLNITAGSQGQFSSTSVSLVGGGQVFTPDPSSGLNPAWRSSYVHNVVSRGWTVDTDMATVQEIKDDITYTKVGAMKRLAPDTGCYMNEADRLDPDYLRDYYGESLSRLEQVKRTYDSNDVFYCQTCVGSERWIEDITGRLCRTQ